MSPSLQQCLDILGVSSEASERDVRRAYAVLLKRIDPALQSHRFVELRHAYETVLDQTRNQTRWSDAREDGLPQNESACAAAEKTHVATPERPSFPGDSPDPTTQRPPPISSENAAAQEARTTPSTSDQADQPVPFTSPRSRAMDGTDYGLDPEEALARDEPGSPFSLPFLVDEPSRAAQIFGQFRLSLDFPSCSLAGAVEVVNWALAQPQIQAMGARAAFEQLLAQAIVSRVFGNHTGAVFLAAAKAFGWEAGHKPCLSEFGMLGHRLQQLITELALLDADARQRWLWLTEEPVPRHAVRLVDAGPAPESISPALVGLFFPEGHLKAWRWARKNAPLLSRVPAFRRKLFLDKVQLFRMLCVLIVPIAIFLFNVMSSSIQDGQAVSQRAACDPVYAHAIRSDWKGLTLTEIAALRSCAELVLPLMCGDRQALAASISHADRLIGRDRFFMFGAQDKFRLDMADGRRFGADDSTNCQERWAFARHAKWIGEADAEAASAFIRQLAACPVGYEESPALRELLKRTDAWPGLQGSQVRVPVKRLVEEADRPPVEDFGLRLDAFSACATAFDDSQNLRIGERELL